jgi:hypothetical protein
VSLTTKHAVETMVPELASGISDEAWVQVLDDADALTNAALFPGPKAELAARYYVAHKLTMDKRGGGVVGALQSYRAGNVAAAFASNTLSGSLMEAWLLSTSYGQALIGMTRAAAAGPWVA